MQSVKIKCRDDIAIRTAVMAGTSQAYKRIGRTNSFVRYGLPMISLTILGSLGLSHLQQGRKDVIQAREDEEWAAIGASKLLSREGPILGHEQKTRKKIDLEEELKLYKWCKSKVAHCVMCNAQAFREKVDINAYEYKPVPKLRQLEE